MTENKQSCKIVKPCLTVKTSKEEQITLTQNNKIVPDERELVEIFNGYFSNIASNIGNQHDLTLHLNPVSNTIKNWKPPMYIENKKISSIWSSFPFSFRKATLTEIIFEIKITDEATQSNDILTKVMYYILLFLLLKTIIILSKAGIQKISKEWKAKLHVCKHCMYKQTNKYFEPILSKYKFGFKKGYSAHQCLLAMIEKSDFFYIKMELAQ